MRQRSNVLVLMATALLALAMPVGAQQFWGNYTPVQYGMGLPDQPGGFTFCRLAYTSVRNTPSGSGWRVDFPQGDRHFSMRLSELTPTPVSRWSHGEPGFAVVRVTDPEVYQCPFLFAADVGELGFSEDEVAAMREYLLKGGFLWADDFWGSAEWAYFARELERVFPEYEFVDLSLDHPLFSIVYHVPEIPQIPNIGFWRRTGGQTSEQGTDSAVPHLRAILDDTGRILVIATHNTDIADGWEREMEDDEFFLLFSPDAYAIGVNIAVWIMTH